VARYIVKRIAWGVVTLALFVTALFFLINILMPGDFMTQFRLGLSADQRAELASQLGVDRPLWQQYWDWMSGMVTGDLGVAFVGDSVARLVVGAMATSLMLFFAGVLIAFPIGNLLGRIGSWKRSGFFLGSTTLVAIVFFTAFPPSLAFLLERGLQNTTTPGTYLAVTNLENGAWRQARLFGGVPAADGVVPEPSDILWGMVLTAMLALVLVMVINQVIRRVRRRGLPLIALMGSTLAASWVIWVLVGWRSQAALDLLGVLLLPMIGVVLLFYGEIQLVTEAAMEEAIDADFITTARAKGLDERYIRDHHAARAAILPVLSRLVVSIPYFLAGLTILEAVFDVPGGLGNLIFGAIRNQDTAIVVGALVVVGAFSLLARLVMDVLSAVLDPRIRYRTGRLEVGLD